MNSRPIGEDILKRAVTIVIHRQMNNMKEMNDNVEMYVAKPFDVFMQELEERYERRMKGKENR